MKHQLSSILLLACFSAYAQEYRVDKGKIEEVTVYFSGASVTQESRITLAQGTHSIVFEQLPSDIDYAKSSLQAPDDVQILSMRKEIRSQVENNNFPVLRKINDSTDLVKNLQKACSFRIEALTLELDLLKRNLYIGGSNSGVNITELQKATELFRLRQDDIYKKLLAESQNSEILNRLASELSERKSIVMFQLDKLNSRIVAQVRIVKEGIYTIRLKYFTTGAAWKPIYDIRVADVGQPMELVQKGKIQNNTGLDWKNVRMTLSTADPSMSIIRPELAVWEIGIQHTMPYVFKNKSSDEDHMAKRANSSYQAAPGSMVNVSELSNEFMISEPANIPSGIMIQTVEIKRYMLNTFYEYTSIPKLEKQPWLIGKTIDWKTIPLSDGPANIYIGNNYIGESYIDLGTVNDTLEISLGRNKKVVVDYRKKEDMTKKSWLAGTVTESFTYEINIRNNNNVAIVFELWDQLPVSNDKDITVAYSEISGALLDVPTGKLTWKYNLAAGEEKKIVISYTVKYPKSKNVKLNRFKALSTPNF